MVCLLIVNYLSIIGKIIFAAHVYFRHIKTRTTTVAGKTLSPPPRGAGWIQQLVGTNGEGLRWQVERRACWSIFGRILWQYKRTR